MTDLTVEFLREILHYNPDTGIFTWLWRADVGPQWNTRYAQKIAGCIREKAGGHKYWTIGINSRAFDAHRLAVLYMTGKLPEKMVDHEDGDGLNNKWDNLRDASNSQNQANTNLRKDNTSGFKGVYLHKSSSKYCAEITIDGRVRWLGTYDTAREAGAAYEAVAVQHFGKYVRTILAPVSSPGERND